MKLIMIDNYDSFTYNLVQYFRELGASVDVFRNDAITVRRIMVLEPDAVVISPGPCTPKEAGISVQLVREASGRLPLLGVCLGHQSIATAFGGTIRRAAVIMHGKTSQVRHDGSGLFAGLSDPFVATRYHSLIVDRPTLPSCLRVTATTSDGAASTIMAMKHETHDTYGVQFHPESILTLEGKAMLGNFLRLAEGARGRNR